MIKLVFYYTALKIEGLADNTKQLILSWFSFNKLIAFGFSDNDLQLILFSNWLNCAPVKDFSYFILFFNKSMAFGFADKYSHLILSWFFFNNSIAFGFKDK